MLRPDYLEILEKSEVQLIDVAPNIRLRLTNHVIDRRGCESNATLSHNFTNPKLEESIITENSLSINNNEIIVISLRRKTQTQTNNLRNKFSLLNNQKSCPKMI
jgi:hypothetical protein